MNNSPAVAFIKEEEGRYLYVNEPFTRYFGPQAESGQARYRHAASLDRHSSGENDMTVLAGESVVELEEVAPHRMENCIIGWSSNFPFAISRANGCGWNGHRYDGPEGTGRSASPGAKNGGDRTAGGDVART